MPCIRGPGLDILDHPGSFRSSSCSLEHSCLLSFLWQSWKKIIFDTTANLAANVPGKKSSPDRKGRPTIFADDMYICINIYISIYYVYTYICIYLHISTDNAIICKQKRTANRPFLLKSQRDFSCPECRGRSQSLEFLFSSCLPKKLCMIVVRICKGLYTTVEGSIVKVSKGIRVS